MIAESTEVLVLGSGAAGHAALRRLHQAGVTSICLEAADRVGGRVTSLLFGDGTVDLGATFCEGEQGDLLYDLAAPLGLLELTPSPPNTKYLLSNGEALEEAVVEQVVDTLDQYLKNVDKSNAKTIAEYLDEVVKSDQNLMTDPLTPSLLEWYIRSREYGGGSIDPRRGKSLRSLEERKNVPGRRLTWKSPGISVIFDLLMDRHKYALEEIPTNIQLLKEVESIHWHNPNRKVNVKCMDGSLYEAGFVINTLTPGVLKEKIVFDPPLPREKVEIINSYGMYVLDQIFVEFVTPWWESPADYNIIWRPEDKNLFAGNEAWLSGVYTLSSVARNNNVLAARISDEDAKLMELQYDDEVHEGIQKLLKQLFMDKVTNVKATLRTKWNKNRFAKGAYSYRTGLTEDIGGTASRLSEPLRRDGRPLVCFAGEATAQQWAGSVQGAVESGVREAERITNLLNK